MPSRCLPVRWRGSLLCLRALTMADRAELIDSAYQTRDCLYNIALAHYELGEYHESRLVVERLLRRDPTHQEALELHGRIRQTVEKGAAPRAPVHVSKDAYRFALCSLSQTG